MYSVKNHVKNTIKLTYSTNGTVRKHSNLVVIDENIESALEMNVFNNYVFEQLQTKGKTPCRRDGKC